MLESCYNHHFPYSDHFVMDLERTGCIAYKSLTLKNPTVSYVDAEAAKTTDTLPFYCKIDQGKAISSSIYCCSCYQSLKSKN